MHRLIIKAQIENIVQLYISGGLDLKFIFGLYFLSSLFLNNTAINTSIHFYKSNFNTFLDIPYQF